MGGLLFVLSAPSGAGKSTIIRRVRALRADVSLSVSHTTRAPRPGEVDGVAYHFTNPAAFAELVAAGEFVESFEVHGNRYGTTRSELKRWFDEGQHVIADVDVQGAAAIRQALPDAISMFVLPPSLAELERRLRGRGTEDEATVQRRLRNARTEVAAAADFDYILVNDDLNAAVRDVLAIIRAAELRVAAQRTLLASLANEAYSFEIAAE